MTFHRKAMAAAGGIVLAVLLAGGGFWAGRATAPAAPAGYVDVSAAPESLRALLSDPGALQVLGRFISVKDGQIQISTGQENMPEFILPETYPRWPGPMPLLPPTPDMHWIETRLPGDEALQASKDVWTIVNLWASWCAPCVAELPDLDALAGELEESRVGVFTINLDVQEADTPATVGALFEAKGLTRLEPLIAAPEHFDAILAAAGMSRQSVAFPRTVIYAPGGRPFAYINGNAATGIPDEGWSSTAMRAFFSELVTLGLSGDLTGEAGAPR